MKKKKKNIKECNFLKCDSFGTVITQVLHMVDEGQDVVIIFGTIVSQTSFSFFIKAFFADKEGEIFIIATATSFSRMVQGMAFDLLDSELVTVANIEICEDQPISIDIYLDEVLEAIDLSFMALVEPNGKDSKSRELAASVL